MAMKPIVKRITVYILAVMLTLTMTPAYAFAGEEAEDGTTVSNLLFNEETISEEGAAADNDELFMQYVEAKLSEGIENEESGEIPGHARMRRVMPSGINAAIYASLKEQVKLVADGKKTSAVFEVTLEELVLEKNGWTAEELGVPAIAVNGRITQEAKNALTKELAEKTEKRRRSLRNVSLIGLIAAVVIAAVILITAAIRQARVADLGIIGGADGPTSIYVTGSVSPIVAAVLLLLLILSVVGLICAGKTK